MTTSAVLERPTREGSPHETRATPHRATYILSGLIVGLMVVSAAAGLFVDGLYPDGAWAREALRGGDLATLVLAVPLLLGALILSARGSRRAQVVWVAMLGYSIYNYAYYVFGAEFNDVFLLHIAILSMSIFALALLVPRLDVPGIAARIRGGAAARWLGAFLVLVGLGQGGLWAFLLVRFALTGELLADIPEDGQHLVFALDLALLAPTLVLAGILLFRRTAVGLVMGAAVALFGAAYQVNLALAGAFQDAANVPGVQAFPIEGIVFLLGFVIASAVLLLRRQPRA
jgi:hypothetical protein